MVTRKRCSACGEDKDAAHFYCNSGHKDGLSTYCKPCTLADRNRKWREKHPPRAAWVMPTEKACSRCKKVKPLDQFHKRTNAKDGRQPVCAECSTAWATAYNKAHPEYHRTKAREYAARHPDRKADIALRTRLGLPWGTYDRMLAAQEGKCAICGTTKPGGRITRFHVDHDAETGTVRGLLCNLCNVGIGHMRHSEELLLSAIDYLKKF